MSADELDRSLATPVTAPQTRRVASTAPRAPRESTGSDP